MAIIRFVAGAHSHTMLRHLFGAARRANRTRSASLDATAPRQTLDRSIRDACGRLSGIGALVGWHSQFCRLAGLLHACHTAGASEQNQAGIRQRTAVDTCSPMTSLW